MKQVVAYCFSHSVRNFKIRAMVSLDPKLLQYNLPLRINFSVKRQGDNYQILQMLEWFHMLYLKNCFCLMQHLFQIN